MYTDIVPVMIISHPAFKEFQQKTLMQHLQGVAEASRSRIQRLSLFTHTIDKQSLADLAFRLGLLHDIGKASTFFQRYIRGGSRTAYTNHSLISAIIVYFDLLSSSNLANIALMGFKAVQRHHGNLSCFGSENLDNGVLTATTLSIYENVRSQLSADQDMKQFLVKHCIYLPDLTKQDIISLHFALQDFESIEDPDEAIERYLIQNLLFSALIDADKYDAARIDYIPDQSFNSSISYSPDRYISKIAKTGGELDKIRQGLKGAAESLNFDKATKCYSMSAPTGTGKTMACMAFTSSLLGFSNRQRRVIYCLPYTSIIDQNYEEISKVLNENGVDRNDPDIILKHHHLADFSRTNSNDEYDYYDFMNDNLLADSWNSACVISTFVQLFHSLIGARNSLVRKLHNIINSVILLDEVQSLPPKYYVLLRRFFYVLSNRFDTYILTCTATQPFIYEPESYIEVCQPDLFHHPILNRVRLTIHHDPIRLEVFVDELDLNNVGNALFVMNTKKSALKLFDLLKQKYNHDFNIVCLTTLHTPKCRMCYIQYVQESLAARRPILLVSTQLIEAGVDISFAKVFRDFSPLDSIVQVAGRCNRHGELGILGGEMHLLHFSEEKEYSKTVYDEYLLSKTHESLAGRNTIESLEFPDIISRYYRSLKFHAEAKAILSAISDLNYDLNRLDQKPIDQFRLIDDQYDSSILYILLTQKAQSCMDELRAAREVLKNPDLDYETESKAKLTIKRSYQSLVQYQINLRESELKNYNEQMSFYNRLDEHIFYISLSDVTQAYSFETGFLFEPLTYGAVLSL